jgi:hypothetical protein
MYEVTAADIVTMWVYNEVSLDEVVTLIVQKKICVTEIRDTVILEKMVSQRLFLTTLSLYVLLTTTAVLEYFQLESIDDKDLKRLVKNQLEVVTTAATTTTAQEDVETAAQPTQISPAAVNKQASKEEKKESKKMRLSSDIKLPVQEEEEVVSEWLSQNFSIVDLLSFWSSRQIGIQEVLVLVVHKLIAVDEITDVSLLDELVSLWCIEYSSYVL